MFLQEVAPAEGGVCSALVALEPSGRRLDVPALSEHLPCAHVRMEPGVTELAVLTRTA